MKRANILMVGGAVLLVVGVALVWALGRDGGAAASEQQVSVLVARSAIAQGQQGTDLVAAGKVGVDLVPASEADSSALASTTAIASRTVATDIEEGSQILAADLREPTLRSEALTIPEGKSAVALSTGFTSAGAGYVAAGDHVNIYVNVVPDSPGAVTSPTTRLLLSNVEVLDVSNEVAPFERSSQSASAPPTTAQRATGEELTLLVALDAESAEQAIFAASQNELWFTIMADGDDAAQTGGVSYRSNYPVGP